MLRLEYYADPAHGWSKTRREALAKFGVADKVSTCSYERGEYVYLEEDCDGPVLIRAAEAAGAAVRIVEHKPAKGDSHIRNMDRYIGGAA
jgi:hypothetical protein